MLPWLLAAPPLRKECERFGFRSILRCPIPAMKTACGQSPIFVLRLGSDGFAGYLTTINFFFIMFFLSYLCLIFFFLQVKYGKIYFKTRALVFYPFSSYIMNLFKIQCKLFCTSKHGVQSNFGFS
uniref:Uncharacterized protein n=1 Tax=Populus davidiana TaxID=266767 RepID=A0A6M2EUE7_9ROSI